MNGGASPALRPLTPGAWFQGGVRRLNLAGRSGRICAAYTGRLVGCGRCELWSGGRSSKCLQLRCSLEGAGICDSASSDHREEFGERNCGTSLQGLETHPCRQRSGVGLGEFARFVEIGICVVVVTGAVGWWVIAAIYTRHGGK